MGHTYVYTGCFVSGEELREKLGALDRTPLCREIPHPHVTFAYMPEQVEEGLFGEKIAVTVTGYGCDGENEGVQVALSAEDPALQRMIGGLSVPHITLSVSPEGQPWSTRFLTFAPVPPVTLTGRFGGFTGNAPVLAPPGEEV